MGSIIILVFHSRTWILPITLSYFIVLCPIYLILIIMNVSHACLRQCQTLLKLTFIIARPILSSRNISLFMVNIPFREEFLIWIIALRHFILLLALACPLRILFDRCPQEVLFALRRFTDYFWSPYIDLVLIVASRIIFDICRLHLLCMSHECVLEGPVWISI